MPALGLGGSVVTKLMKPLPENLSFQVTFDNLFTSLNLLQYLGSKDIGATGILWANHSAKCPITNQKEMAKKFRGRMDYCYDSANKIIVNDSVITLVSNCQSVNPVGKAKRYSRKTRKIIEVDEPYFVGYHNQNMGGWIAWTKILPYTESRSALRNGGCHCWCLYLMLPCKMFGYFTGSQMQASQDHSICFRREVIDIYRRKYLSRHRGVRSVGRPILVSSRKLVKVPEPVRFDGQGHFKKAT